MSRPVIAVFVAQGCPACHEYLPRATKALKGIPFTVVDFAGGPAAEALGSKYKINATPTTIIQTAGGRVIRKIGAISDADLGALRAEALK